MKRFVLRYFLFLVLLYLLLYAPFSPLAVWLNTYQTKLTLWLSSFFLEPGQLRGHDIWINPTYKIYITQACNGILPLMVLFAGILAYPARTLHKVWWLILGYLAFVIVNIVRILGVTYATMYGEGQADFHWSHDIVGNALLLLVGVGLFAGFVKTARS